ncbi:MAG: ABC transporter ATP-binding protein [Gammaproteobacteria bacterium]|nr:ABC transporter ATP-binding protein [Gammaproteobacteria bacterium]
MSEQFRPEQKGAWLALRDIALIVPRIFRYLWEVAPAMLAIQCVLMFVTAVIPAVIVWMTKVIIDTVVGAASENLAWSAVFLPVAVIFGLWIFQALCDAVSGFTDHMFGEKIWYAAYQRILDKAGALDVAFYETPRFYDQLHHANEQIHRMSNICHSSMNLIQQSFSMIAMVSLLSILHPLAIVVLVATALPRIFMEGHQARKRFDLNAELIRNDRLIDYMKRLLTARDSVKEVRTFRLRDLFVGRFERYRDLYIGKLRQLMLHFLRYNMALNLLSLVGVASIWAYAVFQAVLARITIGDLALVFQAAQNSRASLAGLISSGGRVYENALFATRFFDLMDLDPQSVEGALAPPQADPPAPLPARVERGIEFRNVSFKYPASDGLILDDVSFTIPAGKKVAIVGENGAGKTTLVKLVSRLYDPTQGSVLLDGRDLKDYDLRAYRCGVSVVYQDFFRYDLSAADNVGLGEVDAIGERERVESAAEKAGADDIIERLPNGYETILGKTFDEGVDLSGGEWQHLAIARAFMSDAQILILDEPTAAVDAFREHRLYEQFAEMAADKTVVFISHRFSTVRMADLIVVIENGRAIEVGSHEELMAREGKYAAMFSTQAARYR